MQYHLPISTTYTLKGNTMNSISSSTYLRMHDDNSTRAHDRATAYVGESYAAIEFGAWPQTVQISVGTLNDLEMLLLTALERVHELKNGK